MIDNKRFSKVVKPYLSDKVKSSEKITLVHEDKIITNNDENTKLLNSYFSNVVKQSTTLEFEDIDFSAESLILLKKLFWRGRD